jgi:hypothetical protein
MRKISRNFELRKASFFVGIENFIEIGPKTGIYSCASAVCCS